MIPEGYEDDDNCCPFCGFIENTLPDNVSYLRTGVQLQDRYTIGTVIGAGGFGITYKAWDSALETIVAIKEFFPQGVVLRDNTTSKTSEVSVYNVHDDNFEHGKQRFIKEARSLAKFNSHPGTVSIYDFFEANNTAYIVMEYLDGCNMKEYVAAKKKLPDFEMIRSMTIAISDVLRAVHSVGLIHRDISPDNIFMCLNGNFKLIDFGSVKQSFSDGTLSATVILKHGYAPIEQYSKSGKIGPWTDIYALGATIYKLTTGELPQESVERITSDEVVDICMLNSSIPRSFGAAVMKALAPQVKDRYQTVEEFMKDISSDIPKYEELLLDDEVTENSSEEITAKDETFSSGFDNEYEEVNWVEETEKVIQTETKKVVNEIIVDEPKKPEETVILSKAIEVEEKRNLSAIKKVMIGLIALLLIVPLALIIFNLVMSGSGDESGTKKSTTEATTIAATEETTQLTTEVTTEEVETSESTEAESTENKYETVTFGNYWQEKLNSNHTVDGYLVPSEEDNKSPIKWRVLKKNEDGTAIVMTDKIIESRPFNIKEGAVTWEESTLRNWLNTYFYDEAFSEEEKEAIKLSTVTNEDPGANDTEDYIYLLSESEIRDESFSLSEDMDRKVVATEYAEHNLMRSANEYQMWWLRSSGMVSATYSHGSHGNKYNKEVVIRTGMISTTGLKNELDGIGVRPVICIDLSSPEVKKIGD